MRIFISIILFLTGSGLVAYSYVGTFVNLAGDLERSESASEGAASIMTVIGYILNGEIPQLTTYLYIGAFIIVFAILNVMGLLGRSRKNDR